MILKSALRKERNFVDLNNSVLNYFFVNGYQKSFEQMAHLIGSNSGLKLISNNKEKLEMLEQGNRESFVERASFHENQYFDSTRKISRSIAEIDKQNFESERRVTFDESNISEAKKHTNDDINGLLPRLSDSGIQRRPSLIRLKSKTTKENEELHKFLALRASFFIRIEKSFFFRQN